VTIDVRRIDPNDTQAFDDFYAVYLAADLLGREHIGTVWQREELRAHWIRDSSHRKAEMYGGFVDGELSVVGSIACSLIDRPDHAYLEVFTHPRHRRRGHGSQLLATLEQAAHREGRRILNAETSYPYDGPADGAGSAGTEFARHHGYSFGLGDVCRQLQLPVPTALLDELLAEAAPHHTAYTLRSWVGPVPDDIVADWVALNASLDTEAPSGDLELQELAADVDAHREREATMKDQQRTAFHTVAVAPDGSLAAYNEVVLPAHDPGRIYQWGTLVRPGHRGRRLGLAIKAANLAQVQAAHPGPLVLTTYNAEVNSHMIGINERLGFRPVERLGEFQKKV